ncbi:type IV toxin-antitoxin system AbiEi family antitoxin domain-containing protein [soil metagenome]
MDLETRAAMRRRFAAQHGAATASQLLAAGVSAHQQHWLVNVGDLERAHPEVLLNTASSRSWEQRVMAATLAVPGSLAARRTAGSLWRLDGSKRGIVEVVVIRWDRRHREEYVVHETRRLDPIDHAEVDGIPVTSVARTLIDLAGVLPYERLVQALDDAERRRLVSPAELEARFGDLAKRGRKGTKLLRAVLAARSGTVHESDFRRRVERLLLAAGLPFPALEHEVRRPDGWRARLDLAYPERRLAIELDGRLAHGATRFQADRLRQNQLVLLGWTVLRFTWQDLTERPDRLIAVVRTALRQPA